MVDGRHSGYEASCFVDPTHLDGQGGRTLTVALAAIVRRDLSETPRGPRWVELPTPAAGGDRPDIVLEDVEQSRARVQASEKRP